MVTGIIVGAAATALGFLVGFIAAPYIEDMLILWNAKRGIVDVEDHANEGKS